MKISEKNIFAKGRKNSAEKAGEKAEDEFTKYKKEQDKKHISDFDREVKKILEKSKNKNI